MKRILSSLLCALWLSVFFSPKTFSRDPKATLLFLIIIDVVLLGMLLGIFSGWRKKKESGLVLFSLTLVLISHIILPPLTGRIFYIVAVAPMIVFFGAILASFTLKKKEPNQSLEPTRMDDSSAN